MTAPLALLLAVQVSQAGVAGTIRDELTGEPLAEAVVALSELDVRVVTDASGRFAFVGLTPGPHHLTVARHGFEARTLHALIPRTGTVALDISLRPVPLELRGLVVEPRLALRRVEPGAGASPDEVAADAIRNHPLLAEPDVFRVLEGGDVAVPTEANTGVHVRGGAASHTAFTLDGIPVLGPLHAAGTFSAWNPDAIASVRLDPAARQGVPTLSGAIEGRTRSAGDVATVGTSASTTQARVTFAGPLGEGAGLLLAVRQGLPSSVVPPRDPAKIRGELGDVLGKLELGVGGGLLEVLAFGSENELSSGAVAEWPSGPGPRNRFDWKAESFGVSWEGDVGLGHLEVRGWGARAEASAAVGAPGEPQAMLESRRSDRGVLVRVTRDDAVGRELSLGARVGRGSTGYAVDSDQAFAADGALTSIAAELGGGVPTWRGGRVGGDVDLTATSRGVFASPRVTVESSLGPLATATVAVSRRHQLTQSLRNEESLLGTVFPADLHLGAGMEGVPVARADELSGRLEIRPVTGLAIGVQGYARRLGSVLVVPSRTGGLFSDGGFDVGATDVTGRSLDLTLAGARYGLVAEYAGQHVETRTQGVAFVPWYAPRHRVQLGVVLHVTPTTTLRAAHTGMWGRRATALTGPVEWESCNLLDGGCELAGAPPHGSDLGGLVLASYQRTDVGIRKHWHLGLAGRDAMLATHVTLANVFSRSNVMGYGIDPVTGVPMPVDMLPLVPLVVGVELTF